jgi:hypothetical protein
MDMNSRMAMAEKLSVQQLQQAIQSGSLPAYIGIPLIEQKNKQKSQMAAAQQGQQKPPSVVSSILQQAEQQEQGIDQLPSNLPTEQDEMMGMAGGGIIAFADEGQVRDPEQDPRIIALRQDPSYLAFAENGGVEGDTSLTAFLQAGNTPTSPASQTSPQMSAEQPKKSPSEIAMENTINRINSSTTFNKNSTTPSDAFKNDPGYDPVPASPAGRFIQDKITDTKGALDTYSLRERLYKQYSPAALGLSNASNAEYTAAQEMLKRIRDMSGPELRALAEQGNPPAATAVETTSQASPTQAGPASLGSNAGPEYEPGKAPLAAAKNEGVAALPNAKTVPPGTPGAPRTAPQGSGQGAGNNVANIPLTTDEMRSQTAAGKGSMLDQYAEMLMKEREGSAQNRKDAKAMAIFQAGLGIAGGTSPNPFANISQGVLPATQAYQQELKGIRAEDRDRIKQLMELGMGKEKLAMELKKLGIEEKKVDALVNLYNSKAAGGGDAQAKIDAKNQNTYVQATRNYNSAIGNIDTKIEKIKASQFYGMDPSKYPTLASKIEATNNAVATFEKQKRGISKEHQQFVKGLGIDAPDYENRPVGGSDVDLNQFFKK